jgi:hypothetical protein
LDQEQNMERPKGDWTEQLIDEEMDSLVRERGAKCWTTEIVTATPRPKVR